MRYWVYFNHQTERYGAFEKDKYFAVYKDWAMNYMKGEMLEIVHAESASKAVTVYKKSLKGEGNGH